MARYSSVFSGGASSDALVFWNAGAIPTGFYFRDIGTGVFFDSVKLQNPEPFNFGKRQIIKTADLLNGAQSVQSAPKDNLPLIVSFRCHTSSHQHISNLQEKQGGAYTLKIDEVSYENCTISAFVEKQWYPSEYEYTVSFVQDTA